MWPEDEVTSLTQYYAIQRLASTHKWTVVGAQMILPLEWCARSAKCSLFLRAALWEGPGNGAMLYGAWVDSHSMAVCGVAVSWIMLVLCAYYTCVRFTVNCTIIVQWWGTFAVADFSADVSPYMEMKGYVLFTLVVLSQNLAHKTPYSIAVQPEVPDEWVWHHL